MPRPVKSNKNARPASPVATPVRNTAIPKPSAAKASARTITYEMIAKRAYEISRSAQCGSEVDNWLRAERELKAL